MTKEEILELLKAQMLALRDRSTELQKNSRLRADWVAKTKHMQDTIKNISSCDAIWLDEEYGKWFKKEIQPLVNRIDPSLLNRFNS